MEAAGARLEAELERVLAACTAAWQEASSLAALRPVTVYDPNNVAVWLKAIAKSPVHKQAAALGLIHPRDRNGALVTDRFSTPELEAALEAYRSACAAAADHVRDQLRALAARLTVCLGLSAPRTPRWQCGPSQNPEQKGPPDRLLCTLCECSVLMAGEQ